MEFNCSCWVEWGCCADFQPCQKRTLLKKYPFIIIFDTISVFDGFIQFIGAYKNWSRRRPVRRSIELVGSMTAMKFRLDRHFKKKNFVENIALNMAGEFQSRIVGINGGNHGRNRPMVETLSIFKMARRSRFQRLGTCRDCRIDNPAVPNGGMSIRMTIDSSEESPSRIQAKNH